MGRAELEEWDSAPPDVRTVKSEKGFRGCMILWTAFEIQLYCAS